MEDLAGMLASGQITPVVERTYPLEEVAEAIDRLTSGQARGRLLITP
jgi:NADPH:quinone reductase-like Zn-dependent oxidoreductase